MFAFASSGKTVILWNLDFDDLMAQSCAWLRDYRTNNHNASDDDLQTCSIPPREKEKVKSEKE
jgi:hypothetical protein